MGKLYTLGSPISNTFSVSKNAPLDDRLTVRYIADLTDGENGGIAALVYKGMMVYVQEDNSLYVYIGASSSTWKHKKTGAPMNGGLASNWVKINSFVAPESFLEYYQEQLGAKILNSADSLVSITSPFKGQFAYVKDDFNTSEDESGLYIYTGQDWMKIFTGNSASGSVDISSVITTNGSMPSSGTGFSIAVDDSDALIEETYVDKGFAPNTYYTSRGLNSSDKNGGSDIDFEFITLTKGGESYIQLNSKNDPNWIELYIAEGDTSLGFGMGDVTWMDLNNEEHPMETNPLVLPKETPISFGDKTVDFRGMTETRSDGVYTFGSDGSNYSDVDIYTSKVLPTVYAYADGTPVRVLTEGDKYELENMISEATDFSPITDEEIRNLFQ